MKTLLFSNSALSTNDPSNEVTKSDEVETRGKNNTRHFTTQKNSTHIW